MRISNFLILIGLVLSSCAIQVAPGGGEKDVQPPKLISSVPENSALHYSGKTIELNFDEYIQLKDVATQLIVSPLLKEAPVVKLKKKSILIALDDTLSESTTYTLNFGSSIADVNEGNVNENFQFVFSTGDHIDSLSISGAVQNAKDLKTDAGFLVMLYHSNADSVPLLSRPDYFSRTAKDGSFHIHNIAPGRYKIIAMKEGDGDYKYTPSIEAIGFVDSMVTASDENIRLSVFTEITAGSINKTYSEIPGKAGVVFNQGVKAKTIQWLSDLSRLELYNVRWSENGDSLSIFYKNRNADSLSFRLPEAFPKDTIVIRLLKLESRQGRGLGFNISPLVPADQPYFKPYQLTANRPLSKVDLKRISLMEDSVPLTIELTITDSLRSSFELRNQWKEKKNYSLIFYPNAFTDIFGETNDTLQFKFRTKSETDYGAVSIKVDSLFLGHYILQLVDGEDKLFYQQEFRQSTKLDFSRLEPRIYRLKLISDSNGNGKWDPGIYLQHVHPEKVLYYPDNITIRANWDVEIKWAPTW